MARRAVGAALVALVALSPAGVADADVTTPDGDVTALLEQYAPYLAVRRQSTPCGDGEPYRPIIVDHVLGRDDVELLDGDGELVTTAPTVDDLAAGGEDWSLDLPGDALNPGCRYERWFRSLDAEPTVYGRAVVDGDFLVAQYWLYWVFNDWNDLHESDWEMVQLVFDTTSVESAIEQGPALYAFAQHEGSEYAFLDDAVELESTEETGRGKVRLISGAPVVYPGEGSHASYFDRARWFGKSGATGFGCDDTTPLLEELRPGVVVLPTAAPTTGELAWLSYPGHWGERRPIFDDGPTGPATKLQWDEPIEWVEEEGRSGAVTVPFGGSPATDAFCDLTREASALLQRALDHPVRFGLIVLAVVIALALIVRFSSRGLLRAAARTYRRHPVRLLQIGAALVGAGVVTLAIHWLVLEVTSLDDALDVVGESSPWAVPVLAAIGAVVVLPVTAWVMAATVELAVGADEGRPARWWMPRAGLGTFLTALLITVALTVGSSALVLIPLTALVAARWLVAPVACADGGIPARAGMRRSAALLRGHRWRAIGLLVTMTLVLAISGVIGAALLVLTGISFALASVVVVLCAVVLVPYIALVLALFYLELCGSPGRPLGEVVDGVDAVRDPLGVVGGAGQERGADGQREQLQEGGTDR